MYDSMTDKQSSAPAIHGLPSGWFRPRREEWALLALVGLGVVICFATSGEVDLFSVWWEYISYFGIYLALLGFAAIWLRDRGRPSFRQPWASSLVERALGEGPVNSPYRVPIYELVRGVVIFSLCLAAYTNVKVRYMYLHPAEFDGLFKEWDAQLGLDTVAAQCIEWVKAFPLFEQVLESAYFHDYFFMIAILSLYFFRGNVQGLRIAFAAAGITYLTCIFISTLVPSYGPWALTPDDYGFIRSERVKQAQGVLGWWYRTNAESFAAGTGVNGAAFKGIAAFPSLHVGHMALVAFLSNREFPILTVACLVSMVLTFIATLAFGWHWAIDAPAGIAVAWLGYRVATALVRGDRAAVIESDSAPIRSEVFRGGSEADIVAEAS
jgi:hypothetical protein